MIAGYVSSFCFASGGLISLFSIEATGFTGLALDTENVSVAEEMKTMSAYKRSLYSFIGWQCATAIVGIVLEPKFAFELLLLCAANTSLVTWLQAFKRSICKMERVREGRPELKALKILFNQENLPPIGHEDRGRWDRALSFINSAEGILNENMSGSRALAEWRILTGLQWGTTALLAVGSFAMITFRQ